MKNIKQKLLIPLLLAVFFSFTPANTFAANITGSLDAANSQTGQIIGWALDQNDQSISVDITLFIDGSNSSGQSLGTIKANVSRPDLNQVGVIGDHGYQLTIPTQYRDGNQHQVYAYTGSQLLTGSPKSFTISPNLTGAVDKITDTIIGWALDQNNQTAPVNVSFYADGVLGSGKLMGTATANGARPDLNQVGVQGDHGYTFAIPVQYKDGNVHSLYVYAVSGAASKLISATSANFNLSQSYKGNLESVSDIITGWALNPDNQTQTVTVDLYIDGTISRGSLLGNVAANKPRTDLNNAGYQGNHGFQFAVPQKFRDGKTHQVYAYTNGSLISSSPVSGTFSCSFTNCQNFPVQNSGSTQTTAVGTPEIVFNYAAEHCDDSDIPDSPVRAFRDSNGQINLIAGNTTNYRMVGSSLNTVKKNCNPIMKSIADPAYNKGTYYEWITSPYTLDGKTVYTLVHNEWYAQLIDGRCKSPLGGWLNFITLAQSNDGGANFYHPSNYLIMRPSEPWSTSFNCTPATPGSVATAYNAFEPSNFVKKDNYYYAFYRSETDPLGVTQAGACLMRTSNLGDVNSYQLWSGSGWTNTTSTYCKPIEFSKIEKIHESLTYNSYLKAYVLVGLKFNPTSGSGVYFSTSQDLLSWTEPQKIIALGSDLSLPNGQGRLIYPSLLDPTDSSLNFENTGQEPYLYFSVDNGTANRDLIRQKIRFTVGSSQTPTTSPATSAPTTTVSPTPTPTATPTPTTNPTGLTFPTTNSNVSSYLYPSGSVVNDGGTFYFISGHKKIPFTNWPAFIGLGYSPRNVLNGNLQDYIPSATYFITTANTDHPWGSWLLYGRTIYYYHETGMIPVTSWNIFLNNGGQAKFVVKTNKADITVIQNNTLPFLQLNDSRIYR